MSVKEIQRIDFCSYVYSAKLVLVHQIFTVFQCCVVFICIKCFDVCINNISSKVKGKRVCAVVNKF